MVGNPEDRFSRDVALLLFSSMLQFSPFFDRCSYFIGENESEVRIHGES